MTTETRNALRLRMAQFIVDFEARRDSKGRLLAYNPPANDGGGAYEVAGINERYHPAMAARLRGLINAGKNEEAEKLAAEYLVEYTDVVQKWGPMAPSVEFYLRDSVFNRGPGGAAKILQIALKVPVDGGVGPITKAALAEKGKQAYQLCNALRVAREDYERSWVGYRANFWQGLVNRWDKALQVARSLPMEVPGPAVVPVVVEKPVTKPVPAQNTSQSAPKWGDWLKNAVSGWFSGQKSPSAPPKAIQDAPKAQIPAVVIHHVDRGYTDADLKASNFPPRPGFNPLVSTAERQKVFGTFRYRSAPSAGNPEGIQILDGWEDKNIVRVAIPQMARTKIQHAPQAMYFHRLAATQLQGLWADWEAAGLLDLILTYEGSFVPRFIRGSRSTLSNHAFGTAFDVNYAWNALGAVPAAAGKKGSVRELVPIAHRWGFYWGGHFARQDGMHFEVAKIL